MLEWQGIPLDGLDDGLEADMTTLRNPRARVEWDEVTVIAERVSERVGGLDAYRDLLGGFADHPRTTVIRQILRLAPDVESTYALVFKWLGPSLFPTNTIVYERVRPGALHIEIAIDEPHRGCLPFLEDTGAGIEPELVERVFEPFFTTKGEHGNGLGLATVYGIVTAAGGEVRMQSVLGEGTRFCVELPLCDEAPEPLPGRAPSSRPRTRTGHILVIDDEPAIRGVLERALGRLGHRVASAGSRAEALALVEREPSFDLVISDVMLGAERGPAVVAALEDLLETPVLFISGYADTSEVEVPAGAPVLAKPFGLEELEEHVNQLLAE